MKIARIEQVTASNAVATIGMFVVFDVATGKNCYSGYTLELPWRDNKKNVSCIPAGTYTAKIYKSTRHGTILAIENVKNRTLIRWHAGNYTSQILGCALVGGGIRDINQDQIPDVTNSKRALGGLIEVLRGFDIIELSIAGCNRN